MEKTLVFILALTFTNEVAQAELNYDKQGYLLYCPCMGRFGNQADNLLGSLAFAKKLNRTFVVPPWITYDRGYKTKFVPYEKWFDLESLRGYHRAITLEKFMKDLAPTLWPSEERKVYCYETAMSRSSDKKSCPAKEGNPFGPFWDNFAIDFASSFPVPSHLRYEKSKEEWDQSLSPSRHLLLTFMGAPAAYPVNKDYRHLQKYVDWSDEIKKLTSSFIEEKLTQPYVGIHLRNGIDWKRACEHVGAGGISYAFMSSPQCVGPDKTNKLFTAEMCYPPQEVILKQTLDIVKKHSAKSLYIATDKSDFKDEFRKTFSKAGLSVNIVTLGSDDLQRDLAVLIEADAFVGSCGSSVTAFVVRKREVLKRPNYFSGVFDERAKIEL